MIRRKTPEEYLTSVPAAIRTRMLEERGTLAPGGAAVVGRFFAALHERREPLDAPSTASFDRAAGSESTLATLLRALAQYAPEVSTAAGRALRQDYYAKRGGSAASGNRTQKPQPRDPTTSWPAAWQVMHPALEAAPNKASSKQRYRASITRCAQIVAADKAGTDLTFYEAWRLTTALAEEGVAPITIAGYLDGLVALGRYGGVPDDDLDGVRHMRDLLRDEARLNGKRKYGRIAEIMERGGFGYVAGQIGAMREELATLPDHAARSENLRQRIALCALHMNKPARTGDVSRWTIGDELVRSPDGTWRLEWRQEKSGHDTAAGVL